VISPGPGEPAARGLEHGAGLVDRVHLEPGGGQLPREAAGPAADVERGPRAFGQLRHQQRVVVVVVVERHAPNLPEDRSGECPIGHGEGKQGLVKHALNS
jgi:hypothetical protein